MLKFAFGLSTGVLVGIAGSTVAVVLAAVIIEDSPEIRKMITEIYNA